MKFLIDYLREKIAAQAKSLHIRHAILFGSQATGKSSHSSDIDIGVYLESNFFNSKSVLQHQLEIATKLETLLDESEVDIVILNDAPPVLKYEVYTKGILVYCDNPEFADEQYVIALKEYFDFLPILEMFYQDALSYFKSEQQ